MLAALPEGGAGGSVVAYYKQSPLETHARPLEAADFESMFGVDYTPGLVVPEEARGVVLGKKSYVRLLPTTRLIADAYRDAARSGRSAATFVAPVSADVGLGLFAAEGVPRGGLIGEYAGRLSPSGGSYAIGYINDDQTFRANVDAEKIGNHLRFMNHSYEPNAKVQNVFDAGLWHVFFIAQRAIREGEQILFDYGRGYWSVMAALGRSGPASLKP